MTTPNTDTKFTSREARARLIRERFAVRHGWNRWSTSEPAKPKEPESTLQPHNPGRWSWCLMETPRLPSWLFREAHDASIRDELLRIRERGVITPYTRIMRIFEDARLECRDLREV